MAQWRRLSAKHLTFEGPALYVKAVISEASYAIYLTDFIHIWAERLDRRGIMRRAMDENTTIDPTNGPDQLKHLLGHIAKCLQADPSTQTVISSKSDMQTLRLTLTSNLPAPLEPLQWPITLSLEDQACFSSELLLPALKNLQDYRKGLGGLLSVISEKDNVIQKLQDKLEVAGVDIGAVFPGAAPSKASKGLGRAASHSIPGLKEFDYESWISGASGLTRDPVVNDSLPQISEIDVSKVTHWWEELPASDAEDEGYVPDSQVKASSSTQFSVPERQKLSRNESLSSTSTEDDAFAVEVKESDQGNVPLLSREDVVVDSMRETDNAKTAIQPSDRDTEALKNPTRRLGKLGGKKSSISLTPVVNAPETVSVEPSTSRQITPPKKSTKLGRIGGAPKAETRLSSHSDHQAIQIASPVKRESSAENVGHADSRHKGAREERETSQERADRQRAELKRQLEEKKKVAGIKKKQRKF